ncbi:galactose mutarotase-like protein [Lentinula lateritia]|uniref:Galactose mutarotase-like protein n=1 Tax=Lentinula aff. lateritia TaxID=2804960 RepID=A0ACC1TMG2_9AGAR|nr:galactose mutarotase-like protein [Lentinula aff. lateritia]KAJ3848210.1 galactose mutarotase-like protein [Lentinula lateritia]
MAFRAFALTFVSLIRLSLAGTTSTAIQLNETEYSILLANDVISFGLLKTTSAIQNLTYQNVSLLGTVDGLTGQAYTDFPSNTFTTSGNSSYEIITGQDWAGVIFTDNDTLGSTVQRLWFLHASEPGVHSFVRLAYYNDTVTSKGELGESRTMFRPNGGPWTHIITNSEQWAPLPGAAAVAEEVVVQDATWYLGLTPDDPYGLTFTLQESDYFTKYQFADNQTNKAHGLFGYSPDNVTTLGAWWVVNQKDTFFGGPLHGDLMVDGIIYNKQSTNHGGATNPNITNGFDRTFGPQFLYFNHGNQSTTLQELLADAEQFADPSWNAKFYDEIAPYVRGYAPSSVRGTFQATVTVPEGALNPVAVLSANGVEFQAATLAANFTAYQYWAPVEEDGSVSIPRVKEGWYRLTVIATGIFGEYSQDNIIVSAGKVTSVSAAWIAQSAGKELWRIGIPDKTAGEFRNGFERDLTHPNHPAKYRIYWGAWDYPTQFPNGVNFTVGLSNESVDWNYVHWSRFGPTYIRNETVTNVNQWQINFELEEAPSANSIATFTMQLAGVETTAGNTDVASGSNPTVPILTYVNDQSQPLNWTILAYQSSSCGERSAISCHLLHNELEFSGSWLGEGWNKFLVSALFLSSTYYVQYDALRLELIETSSK